MKEGLSTQCSFNHCGSLNEFLNVGQNVKYNYGSNQDYSGPRQNISTVTTQFNLVQLTSRPSYVHSLSASLVSDISPMKIHLPTENQPNDQMAE